MKCLTEGPPDAKIMIIGEAPGCFTEDVEILTPDGWLNISNCDTDTTVAQFNEGVVEFVQPIKVINEDYSGEIVRLSGYLNIGVTPNHRFVIFNSYHNKFMIEEADKLRLSYSEQSLLLSGLKLTGVAISENLIKLLVAVQADGSYDYTGIRFEFSKERKVLKSTSFFVH